MTNTIDFLRSELPFSEFPKISLTLGSGLGSFAEKGMDVVKRIPYDRIPGFASSTVVGHAGQLIFGLVNEVEVVCLQGRFHFYEGYDMATVTFPMRVLAALGVKGVFLSNAAGGIRSDLKPGALMIIQDHINFMGTNPLMGANDDSIGPRFLDMTQAWDSKLMSALELSGRNQSVELCKGIYLAVTGPSFETPAEIRAFAHLGADAVGMSTVPECIVARHSGMRVVGVSCITNAAAGFNEDPLSHEDVSKVASKVESRFINLLMDFVPRFNSEIE